MGATTNTGRTRSRRAQSLNSILNGQGPVLYGYGAVRVGVTLEFELLDSEFQSFLNPAIPPGGMIRVVTSNSGITFFPQTVPVTFNGSKCVITTTPVPDPGSVLIILPWNESLRGPNGEWVSGCVLDVP